MVGWRLWNNFFHRYTSETTQSKPAYLFYWSAFISFHFPFTFEMLKKLYSCILFLPSKRFQVSSLFFAFIVVACMCIYIYIPRYSLLSLNNITCILVFRANHLVLDNLLVLSFLGKSISPFLSIFSGALFLRVMLKSFPLSLWHVYCY